MRALINEDPTLALTRVQPGTPEYYNLALEANRAARAQHQAEGTPSAATLSAAETLGGTSAPQASNDVAMADAGNNQTTEVINMDKPLDYGEEDEDSRMGPA